MQKIRTKEARKPQKITPLKITFLGQDSPIFRKVKKFLKTGK